MRLVSGFTKRRWARAASILLSVSIVGVVPPLSPAVIVVGGGCTLADALDSANTDSAVGGCTAGAGTDDIELTADVVLTSELPIIDTALTIEGEDFSITRDAAAADFRILTFEGPDNQAVRNLTVSNGRAPRGGGISADSNSLTLINTTITGNHATNDGGGLYAGFGYNTVAVLFSTIADNTADDDGGGIFVGDATDLIIRSSTVSGNHATSAGGGMMIYNYSDVVVENSTISGNSAGDFFGAAYLSYDTGMILDNSTVVNNTAPDIGGIGYDNFGAFFLGLRNSIIASNPGDNCSGSTSVDDFGGNFDDDGTCGGTAIAAGVDFDAALANNGGPTRTHALLDGSVAIDAGGPCAFPLDQRQFARDGLCDSGSVEFGAAPVGGSVERSALDGRRVICSNLTTGGSVSFGLNGADTWDCEERGLTVNPGDRIEQTVNSFVVDGGAGSIIGLIGQVASCRNLSTGLGATASLASTTAWDCEDAGVVLNPGDRLRVILRGDVP